MKLHRITSEAMLGGVCAGLAYYLGVPVLLVRLVFIVLVFVSGIGIFAYLLLWFLLPTENTVRAEMGFTSQEWASRGQQFGQEVNDLFTRRRENTLRLLGIVLVILGIQALLRIFVPNIFTWIDKLNGPLTLMVLGGILLFLAFKRGRK
ncbi:MAG: PspC domain-containing protein [Chloroflexi bacterium]|nr:PspC domain-containing protein [Chloroflexota bacterium]